MKYKIITIPALIGIVLVFIAFQLWAFQLSNIMNYV